MKATIVVHGSNAAGWCAHLETISGLDLDAGLQRYAEATNLPAETHEHGESAAEAVARLRHHLDSILGGH